MKRYLIIPVLALMTACNNSGTTKATTTGTDSNKLSASVVNNPHTANGLDANVANSKPVLDFKDTLHDFGSIHVDEVVQYEFSFANTGKGPLIISNAQASCGCTVADYPHDPILPGQSGVMKVTFSSAGKSGHQEKSVAVHTNTVRGIHMLYIQADIATK